MGALRVELTNRAAKDLDRLLRAQPVLFERVAAKVALLREDPGCGKTLVGPLKGIWSLRVGDQRILYQIETDAIVILTVNHRREAYK